MAEFPALPLFTDAYMADTLDLNAEQHGAYLLLLMLAWRRPDCAIPNDMNWLKRSMNGMARDMHGNRFNKLIPSLLAQYFILENDGKYHQKRLRKERDFLKKRSEKQREIANKRWSADKENNDLADANAVPDGNAPTPTPTPTPINLVVGEENELTQPRINAVQPSAEQSVSQNTKYRFAGRVIKLNERDFNQWQASYSFLDLQGELQSLDDWMSSKDFKGSTAGWFHMVSKVLANKNAEMKLKQPKPKVRNMVV